MKGILRNAHEMGTIDHDARGVLPPITLPHLEPPDARNVPVQDEDITRSSLANP